MGEWVVGKWVVGDGYLVIGVFLAVTRESVGLFHGFGGVVGGLEVLCGQVFEAVDEGLHL